MAICEYCDSRLDNNVTTCPNCGAPVPVIPVQEAPQTTYTAESTEEVFGSWGKAATAGMGASILGSLLRGAARSSMYRSMHRPSPPPMGGMFHGHGRPGHRGSPGGHRGPGRGPGGHRGGPR